MEGGIYRKVLIIIFIASLLLLGFENICAITGHVTETTTPSQVTIMRSLAISFSSQLGEGIIFDEVRFLPATNVNATHNYDGIANASGYFVLVSPDGNVPVDVCLRAEGPLTTIGGDTIPLVGETYSHSKSSNITTPSVLLEAPLTTDYVLSSENIPLGGTGYLRFFLDVPTAQAPGDYSNNIFFKGTPTGAGC